MAKRKKAATKPVATRRTTRRGKQAASDAADTEGETSTAVEPSTSQTTTTKISPTHDSDSTTTEEKSVPQPQTSGMSNFPAMKPCQVPIVALHKKFGKYRCLFNNEDGFTRKYEVGSDSETNSSVEIRVVDPCASSESDSNAALDIQSDTNSGVCLSPMNSIITPLQNNSRDISPVPMLHEMPQICEIPLLGDSIEVDLIPKEQEIAVPEIEKPVENQETVMEKLENEPQSECKDVVLLDDLSNAKEEIPVNQDIPLEEQTEFCAGEDDDDDDEVITIVQIVEDDYYNIKIDSPKDELIEEQDISVNEDLGNKSTDIDFQKHFEQLNIAPVVISDSSMECSDIIDIRTPPCSTPDIPFPKENYSEALMRPDPSITPSSTLSDDSNSSRVTEQNQNNSNDSAESSPTGVRRSNRIKTISNMKQKTKGYGLVKTPLKKALITQTKLKLEELGSDSQEKSTDMIPSNAPNSPSFPVPLDMPVKVKSRWRRSSELEMGANSPANSPLASPSLPQRLLPISEMNSHPDEECPVIPMTKEAYDRIIEERMNQYQHLDENEYLCERMISKETKKMICDCFMTKEELERGELACGEDCLNRLLMIECNSRCPVGDRCTNRRFQKTEIASLKVFYADKKGCGVEAAADIPTGEFLMEYVGEVLDYEQFYKRAQTYSDENNMHHYFMSLKGDTVIDATLKGNISRFINHSCDPNAETQKWTVNGELRIGFFSKRDIVSGEEITFDYQFQRFGKVAQRCYCGADNCRGWIGAEPDSDDEDDEEEEEEDVSTSKSGTTESSEECQVTPTETPRPRPRRPKRERKYKPKAPDLVQDADIEEDLEALNRTGVKNQSHTLRLSRTVVRAKTRRAQTALLRLLRDSDLPCRRLFLDYRGLRLLAPWCTDAPLDFRLEMLQTVDRLPIPNKTMVQESRFFTIVERWLSAADTLADTVFIDENTGLPIDLPNRGQENLTSPEKVKENAAIIDKIKDLSNQLLERWSSLKEVFKIPKKERIQQMKEHERQANVERRAADSSGTRDRERREDRDRDRERERERDKERERDRERERERERERDRERSDRDRDRERHRERDRERDRDRDRDDRDRRKRRSSPEGRRSIRLSERVLAAVPPMSKEERRRAFAEAAAVADETRRQRDARDPRDPRDSRDQRDPRDINSHWPHYWPQHDAHAFQQMFPPGMLGGAGNMVPMPAGMPPGMLGMMPEAPPDWLTSSEFQATAFCPPFGGPQPFCMPQPNMMGMGGFNMGGFMFGQQLAGAPPFPHPHPQQPHPQQPQPQLPQQLDMQLQQVQTQVPLDSKDVVLPSMWRSATDSRGRTYYYHVKQRRPQWLPPPPPELTNSPDDSSSDEEEEQPNALDSPIVRRHVKGKLVEGVDGIYEVIKSDSHKNGLIPDHALVNMKPRKRRPGLVSERPISPRTEEDKLAGRLEVKRYRQTKEKLRRRREKLLQRVRQLATTKHRKPKVPVPVPVQNSVDLVDSESDTEDETDDIITEKPVESPPISSPVVVASSPAPVATVAPVAAVALVATVAPVVAEVEAEVEVDAEDVARRIKEQFRSSMARVMVHHLNPYRHSDAPAGRITCTSDFKHLARKLTHFVMLKELKHCRSVDELIVTDSVRSKAKMFVKKYMAKFGPVYKRPPEEAD